MVNLMDPQHEQEFQVFRRMGTVYAMVFLSGFLNDVYETRRNRLVGQSAPAHLQDAREMLNTLAKDWALEKGYRVTGNLIEAGTSPDPYRTLAGLQRTVQPTDRRTLRVVNSESAEYRDFGFSTFEDAAAAQEILVWLEPEPAVGSAIVENSDIDVLMKDWEAFAGKPLSQSQDPGRSTR